uniref:Tetraspanin n=1 Tax=Culicoides sonorensis TaxID=179676 RepID=A0A336M6E9_CULSO
MLKLSILRIREIFVECVKWKRIVALAMGLDCGSFIAKYLLCLFNFLFFVAGTIILGIGVWLAVDKASFISLLKMVESEQLQKFTQPSVIEQLAYVLIVVGAIMFFLSFLGYCGAIRESQCLLTMYAIFLILLLVLEVVAGGLAAAYRDRAKHETKTFLENTITSYYSTTERSDAVTLMWNHLMGQMSCCGVNDYKDFELSDNWTTYKHNRTIPEACCILSDTVRFTPRDLSCPSAPSDQNSNWKKGCYDAVVEYLLLHRNLVIVALIVVGLIQILAIFLAFCLCKSLEKYRGLRL